MINEAMLSVRLRRKTVLNPAQPNSRHQSYGQIPHGRSLKTPVYAIAAGRILVYQLAVGYAYQACRLAVHEVPTICAGNRPTAPHPMRIVLLWQAAAYTLIREHRDGDTLCVVLIEHLLLRYTPISHVEISSPSTPQTLSGEDESSAWR